MNNKEKLLTDIKNDESVKRCHELERMIDENKEIAKYPFVNEYLELLDYLYNDLEIMTDYITSKINKELEN